MPWSPEFWVSVGGRILLAMASFVPILERRLYPDHQLARDLRIDPGGDDNTPSLVLTEQWKAPAVRLRLRVENRSPYRRALLDRIVLRIDGGAVLSLYDEVIWRFSRDPQLVQLETVITCKQEDWFRTVIDRGDNVRVVGSAAVVFAHRNVRRQIEFAVPLKAA